VLPFRNLSDGGGGGYMADAITDDLTTDLAHIPGSAVTSRASAEGFRDRGGSAARIGAALNVRYLVDGSLRAADGTFLIDVALIEAASGRQLWAQRFATTVVRLAAAQTQIVRRIASALDVELPNIVSANSLRDRPNNPTSEDLFIRAYATLMQEDTLAGYTRAQHLLEQAVRLEPGFGDALAELGLTLILKLQSAVDPAAYADLAEARDVIGRSLDLASNPIALAANARLLEYEGACEQAVPSAQAALALEPNSIDALAVLAKCATEAGHFDQASDYLRTVLQLNPDSVRSKPRLALLTQAYLLQGRYGEAIESGNRALAGDRPPQPGADSMGRAEYVRLMIMAATALSGDVAGARALYAEYRAVWPNRSAWRVAAYSPEGLASSAGFAKFITGLTQAGMPMYADERAAAPDPSDTSAVQEGDFARSPLVIRGARTLDTPAMAALIAHGGVTVFDLGQGAAVIRNAILVTAPADRTAPPLDGWPADRIPADKQAPIVVMGDGVYGTAAVAAVRSLVARFYQHVYWYRGGEEAWAAAGLPSEDRRQQL
jgi:adenylate cyclase